MTEDTTFVDVQAFLKEVFKAAEGLPSRVTIEVTERTPERVTLTVGPAADDDPEDET